MTPTYYSQPSTDYAPHDRGYRLCDGCGDAENASITKFRICGGCMLTQYCSSSCQKVDWPEHRSICQHTTNTVAAVKYNPTPTSNETIAKELRRFTSRYSTMLAWAGYHGLHLMRHPHNIHTQALLIELKPKHTSDPNRRFTVRATHIVPRTYITDQDALILGDIQRRDERSRRSGGLGTALVVIRCGGVSQVMPVECECVNWALQKDWASVVHHCVENGLTNFGVSSQGLFHE